MRPVPTVPALIRFDGALRPNTGAGTIHGKVINPLPVAKARLIKDLPVVM
jgi:hypothetical protein